MLLSSWKEVVRTTRTTPTVFLLASKRCSIEVVLTSRKPLKLHGRPLRGGDRREDLPFERIIAGGCSDSVDRRPTGYRG